MTVRAEKQRYLYMYVTFTPMFFGGEDQSFHGDFGINDHP
jgi:hypothetical protein